MPAPTTRPGGPRAWIGDCRTTPSAPRQFAGVVQFGAAGPVPAFSLPEGVYVDLRVLVSQRSHLKRQPTRR